MRQEVACSYQRWECFLKLVLFKQFNNSGAIDVKMDGSIPEEKSSFKMV